MNRKLWVGAALSSLVVLAACDDSVSTGGAGGGEAGAAAGGANAGAADATGGNGTGGGSSDGWAALITADWSLEAGGELTSDIHTLVLDRDMYVGAIRPIAPTGTHHTVLALNNLGMGNVIYASGVGTNAIEFPAGVGLKLHAGETIVLQLHLFNPTGAAIGGTSGIEIVEIAPEDIENEADIYLPGPLGLDIPPNQESTQSSTCTVNATQTLFAVFPHMHQLGSHFKTTLTVAGNDVVIHDDDYEFVHQAFIPFDPVTLNAGDSITTECTWNNTTSNSVGWGESSNSEMCFSIVYRYPAQNDAGFCDG